MKKRKTSTTSNRLAETPAGGNHQRSLTEAGTEEVMRSEAFLEATKEAEACTKNPEQMRKLLLNAMDKVNYVPRGPFVETWPYLMAMIRLVRAYHQGEFQDVSKELLLIILAAIIYFTSPYDAIPDAVPIIGQIDDALVVRLAMKSVAADLDAFMAWETVKI